MRESEKEISEEATSKLRPRKRAEKSGRRGEEGQGRGKAHENPQKQWEFGASQEVRGGWEGQRGKLAKKMDVATSDRSSKEV